MIVGLYANGIEESALYSPLYRNDEAALPIEQHHSAIWVDPWIQSERLSLSKKTIIGKFQNGPSGHMSAYFGRLTDATALPVGVNSN
jgi:hypothetical protein